jgi:hypothetical protein
MTDIVLWIVLFSYIGSVFQRYSLI